jgi:hypothetical protein
LMNLKQSTQQCHIKAMIICKIVINHTHIFSRHASVNCLFKFLHILTFYIFFPLKGWLWHIHHDVLGVLGIPKNSDD